MLEPELIDHWFLQYGDEIHHYLSYYTRNHDVEDLVQETFIRAWKGLPRYKEKSGPKTWLCSIARNVAIDARRKSQRQPKSVQATLDDLPSPHHTPEEMVAMRDVQNQILRALDSIRSGYKDVILCRTIMDMSISETAEVLGWTKTRVNVTLHRGIRALRIELMSIQGGALHELAERG